MPTIFNPKRKNAIFINTGGTVSPTPAPPSFSNTKSLAFDGVDETVNLGNVTALNGSTSGSFSMWIKLNSTGIEGLFNQWGSPSDRLIYSWIWLGGGRIDIYMNDQLRFRVSGNAIINALSTGQWFNLVIAYDGTLSASSRVKVYIDNQELTGNIYTGPTSLYSSTTDFIIGYYPSGSYIDGNIDEFAIFTNTLTTDNINDIYNGGTPNDLTSLSPVLWYRMGDNSTYQTPQILMPENTNKNKVSNYSLSFDGVDDYVDINNTSLSGATNFSVSLWINRTADANEEFFSIYAGTSMKFFLETRVNQRLGVYLGAFIYKNFALSTPPDWNHVLVTFDGTQAINTDKVKLYVNGSEVTGLIGSTSLTSLPAGLTKIYIGKRNSYFAGNIDEVAIFDTTLSASDVTSIYNGGTPTTISGAVAHWRMGEQATFSTNWTVPDQVGSSDGTSANMTIEDRVGDAPNSSTNAVSFNMEEADISNDTP